MSYYMEGGDMDGLRRADEYDFIPEKDREEVEKRRSVYRRTIQDNLEEAMRQIVCAENYIGFAIDRSTLGEMKNAQLLAEVAERGILRAFLYIKTALKDAKDNEQNS